MAVLLMAGVLSVPQGGSILAQAAEEPETATAAESLSAAKTSNGLVKKNGKYYYYKSGKMLKNRWVTVNKKKYYLGADGAAKTGWYTIREKKGYKTYYFNSKGILQSRYTKSADKTLIVAADRLIKKQGITYKTGTNKALLKLYNYMRDPRYFSYGREEVPSQNGWDVTYAGKMMTTKTGNCYSFASAYAYLVKRATGLPVRIATGSTNAFRADNWQYHAWCEVKIQGLWYTFDPNLAWVAKKNPKGITNPAAKGKSFYRQNRSKMVGKLYKGANGSGTPKYVEVKI